MLPQLALLCLLSSPSAPGDKPEPVDPGAARPREIKVAPLPAVQGDIFGKPTRITSREELLKTFADKEAAAKLLKEVNLNKEVLLLFSWQGSGQDQLTMMAGKEEVTFTLKGGLTRDLRRHNRLFCVPRKMKVTVRK